MGSELNRITSKPAKTGESDPDDNDVSPKDDLPLLESAAEGIQELEKKFAAFVRNDVYGSMGREKLPLKEKLLLGIALVSLLPYDEQEDFAHLGGCRRAVIVQSGRFLSRLLLFTVGFYWLNETRKDSANTQESSKTESTKQSEEQERPGAIVSNHLSYLDIFYHMSSSFPSFVAKRSVSKLPLIGLIGKCLGCVYVQRESKSSDFKGVAEGTTSNGDFPLPFKTGAFLAGAPVVPVILRYSDRRFSPAWDSISGGRHVVFLLCQFVNHLEVIWLPVYLPSQQEKDNPKLYANNDRKLMASEGGLILSDIRLAEKRIYLAALNGNNSLPSVLHPKKRLINSSTLASTCYLSSVEFLSLH
ncbi:Lysophospholipid acyltransferase LPEAT1 [Hibiscus syriacus]|uniref:Lysophospholipid acyltransferase LPEAT1 n=1 Tax=Hibiscus syriacus TaxID=106335 RepID=A0A6A2XI25_HIBSY|nr:Lysophospholipid acyltransferase LPEAT1 [Hibiscus syriacus]